MAREAHAERARRRKKVPPVVREEKQLSPFPGRAFWAGPRAVFSSQIKDLGLTAIVCDAWLFERDRGERSLEKLDTVERKIPAAAGSIKAPVSDPLGIEQCSFVHVYSRRRNRVIRKPLPSVRREFGLSDALKVMESGAEMEEKEPPSINSMSCPRDRTVQEDLHLARPNPLGIEKCSFVCVYSRRRNRVIRKPLPSVRREFGLSDALKVMESRAEMEEKEPPSINSMSCPRDRTVQEDLHLASVSILSASFPYHDHIVDPNERRTSSDPTHIRPFSPVVHYFVTSVWCASAIIPYTMGYILKCHSRNKSGGAEHTQDNDPPTHPEGEAALSSLSTKRFYLF
eukprot:Gb_26089 [translate_table: standard]